MSDLAARLDDGRADRLAFEQLADRLPKGDLFLKYQQRTVDKLFTGTALLIVEKSRRIGLTWGIAAYCVLKAASQVSAGGQSCWYMGYDKDMTLEFIETCAMWARAFGFAAEDVGEELMDDGDGGSVQAFRIRFSSGFKITALPSVPRALRGKQGIVVIDEAAFHKNVDEVIKSAMALLIWGGQVVVISTHDGISNPFNVLVESVRNKERKGEVVTIDFDQAIADGLYERVAMVAKTKGAEIPGKADWIADIRAFYGDDAEEELDCVPKNGAGSLISIEDIIACEHDECGLPEMYEGGPCYLGRDVARRKDGQVQYVMELIRSVLWQRDTYEETGQTFAHQDAFFDRMFAERRIAAAWVDQGGMGEKVVEDLQTKHGSRVVGKLLQGPNRVALALSLQRRFQERTIRIRKDPKTRKDLMAIKKTGSIENSSVRIVNDGSVHADRFWAYSLASLAAELPAALYQYHGVKRGQPVRLPGGGRDHPEDRRRSGRAGFGRGAW